MVSTPYLRISSSSKMSQRRFVCREYRATIPTKKVCISAARNSAMWICSKKCLSPYCRAVSHAAQQQCRVSKPQKDREEGRANKAMVETSAEKKTNEEGTEPAVQQCQPAHEKLDLEKRRAEIFRNMRSKEGGSVAIAHSILHEKATMLASHKILGLGRNFFVLSFGQSVPR